MNQVIGNFLIGVFILSVGMFHLAVGIRAIRKRTKKTWIGVTRIAMALGLFGIYTTYRLFWS